MRGKLLTLAVFWLNGATAATTIPKWNMVQCDAGTNVSSNYCAAILNAKRRICVVHRDPPAPVWCIDAGKAVHPREGAKAVASPDAHYLVVAAWMPVYDPTKTALYAYRDGKQVWSLRARDVVEQRDAAALKGEEEGSWIAALGFAEPTVLAVVTGSGLIRQFDVKTGIFLSEWALPKSKADVLRKTDKTQNGH